MSKPYSQYLVVTGFHFNSWAYCLFGYFIGFRNRIWSVLLFALLGVAALCWTFLETAAFLHGLLLWSLIHIEHWNMDYFILFIFVLVYIYWNTVSYISLLLWSRYVAKDDVELILLPSSLHYRCSSTCKIYMVLRANPEPSNMLGKRSTKWAHPKPPKIIFKVQIHFQWCSRKAREMDISFFAEFVYVCLSMAELLLMKWE